MVVAEIIGLTALYIRKYGRGQRMVSVVAMTDTLTEGSIGDNGSINQPTHAHGKVMVRKPPTKKIFQTRSGHVFSDTTMPKIRYGVVYYSEDDDGRRDYSFVNSGGEEQERNASVFSSKTQGYYIAEYNPERKEYFNGVEFSNPYGGTGIKDWYILNPDNRDIADSKLDAIAKANMMFENKIEPQPEPSQPEDDNDPFPNPIAPISPISPIMPMNPVNMVEAPNPSVVGEEETHTMPDGTVMKGAEHIEFVKPKPQFGSTSYNIGGWN